MNEKEQLIKEATKYFRRENLRHMTGAELQREKEMEQRESVILLLEKAYDTAVRDSLNVRCWFSAEFIEMILDELRPKPFEFIPWEDSMKNPDNWTDEMREDAGLPRVG